MNISPHLFVLALALVLPNCQGSQQHSGQQVLVEFLPAEPSAEVFVVRRRDWITSSGKDLFLAYELAGAAGNDMDQRHAFLTWLHKNVKHRGASGSKFKVLDYPSVAVFVTDQSLRKYEFSPMSKSVVNLAWE